MSENCKCDKCCNCNEPVEDIDDDYKNLVFDDGVLSRKKVESALEKAHEIRKFEIELYWRRALYFWGFIAVLLTGYGFLLGTGNDNGIFDIYINNANVGVGIKSGDDYGNGIKEIAALAISYLGLLISIAWYYLEQGAKAYQANWELHIDYLEKPITGHLHKTLIGDRIDYFSVSKINRHIIVLIGFLWLFANYISAFIIEYNNSNISWHNTKPMLSNWWGYSILSIVVITEWLTKFALIRTLLKIIWEVIMFIPSVFIGTKIKNFENSLTQCWECITTNLCKCFKETKKLPFWGEWKTTIPDEPKFTADNKLNKFEITQRETPKKKRKKP